MVICRVLGPLQLEIGGVSHRLGSPVVRRLLTALLLADGQSVADEQLTELIWLDQHPADPCRALRGAVWRLRGVLGGEVLRRTANGYQLAVATDQREFAALVEAGLNHVTAGNPDRAAVALGAALRLWRGEPWCELGDATGVIGPRTRLTELRELALEELQAARLSLGAAPSVVRVLDLLVAESPYRERRWELLIRAHIQLRRPDLARAKLLTIRSLLATDLGLELGPGLRELEHTVLPRTPVRPANWRWR